MKQFIRLSAILILLHSITSAQNPWTRISPVPQENTITDLTIIPGSGRLVAVGERSTVMFSDNQGADWEIKLNPAGMNNQFTAKGICFVSETTGFIHGSGGTILKTTDGGNTWALKHQKYTDPDKGFHHMKFIDDSIGFVCGENGVALKTTDGGETWSAIATGTTANLMKIVFRDSRNGFIYASSQGLITSDGGTTWTWGTIFEGLAGNSINDCVFTNDSTGYVFNMANYPNYESYIYKTTDKGASWKMVCQNNSDAFTGKFAFFDEQRGMAACNSFDYMIKILLTNDGGETWTLNDQPFIPWYAADALIYTGEQHAITAGINGMIFTSENGGQSWEKAYAKNLFGEGDIYKVQFPVINTGYAIVNGSGGGVAMESLMKTTDAGNTWSTIIFDCGDGFLNLHFVSETTGYVVNESFHETIDLAKTTDGGDTWAYHSTGIQFADKGTDFAFFDENNGYIIGTYEIFKTSDGGVSWENIAPTYNSSNKFNKIAFRSKDEIIITGAFNGKAAIYRSANGGADWMPHIVNDSSISEEIALPDEETIVVNCGTQIMKSSDNGITWQLADTDADWLTYNYITFTSPLIGYVVGEGQFSNIMKTTDGGNTWSSLNTNSTSELYTAWFTDDDNGYAYGGKGLIINTTTGGILNINNLYTFKDAEIFTLFPNPATEVIILKPEQDRLLKDKIMLTITDIAGSVVIKKEFSPSKRQLIINAQALKPGVYIAHIQMADGKNESHKIVKL